MCPLDRVLTYKNLIYLLNLQFYLWGGGGGGGGEVNHKQNKILSYRYTEPFKFL